MLHTGRNILIALSFSTLVGMAALFTASAAFAEEGPPAFDRVGWYADLTEHIVLDVEASYLVPTGSVSGERYGTFGAGLQYRF